MSWREGFPCPSYHFCSLLDLLQSQGEKYIFDNRLPGPGWWQREREGAHEVARLQRHQHTSSTLGSNPPPRIDVHFFFLLVTLSLIYMNLQVGKFPRCECSHFHSELSQVTSHVWHTLSRACILHKELCLCALYRTVLCRGQ